MEKNQHLIKRIQDLISQDKTKDAIDVLIEEAKDQNNDFLDSIVLIESNYYDLINRKNRNTIRIEDELIEKAKIKEAILNLVSLQSEQSRKMGNLTFRSLMLYSVLVLLVLTFIFYAASFYIAEKKNSGTRMIPFNSGWIFTGYFDDKKNIYLDGAFTEVIYRPASGEKGAILPRIGDVIEVEKARRIIIANYKTDSLKYQLTSPALVKGVIGDNDRTEILLEKGVILLVQDVVFSNYPDKPVAVWCRIIECEIDSPNCKRAIFEMNSN